MPRSQLHRRGPGTSQTWAKLGNEHEPNRLVGFIAAWLEWESRSLRLFHAEDEGASRCRPLSGPGRRQRLSAIWGAPGWYHLAGWGGVGRQFALRFGDTSRQQK